MKTICFFSGWFELRDETVLLNTDTDESKTLKEWRELQDNLDNLILDSFGDASNKAVDGEFDECYLVEEED